jgi:cysteine desulfurase
VPTSASDFAVNPPRTAPIYLDYHATTPIDPRVFEAMTPYFLEHFGNPSSSDHTYGDIADRAVQTAREQIASLLDAHPRNIFFTSGATESVNLAIQGTVKAIAQSGRRPRIACTTIEHKAVLDTCRQLAQDDRVDLTEIPVDDRARIDLKEIERCCADGLDLLCVMAANNEVGTIYPMRDLAVIAQRHHVVFLCDASQAVGKIPITINTWGIDLVALSAHKFSGPKGIGAIIVRKKSPILPLLYGGGQQRGLRPGSLNVPGIVGLGVACHLRQREQSVEELRIQALRDRLQSKLAAAIPQLRVNGDLDHRLAGNLHITVPGVPNSAIVARVRDRLAISTGSACSSGVETPSHVLRAMRLTQEECESSLRIGLGQFTTQDEVDEAAVVLVSEIKTIYGLLGMPEVL